VQAGVVSGTFFDVMGLHPVLGRLIEPQDDGPKAAGVVVLTYRFWAATLGKDPSVLGKTVRLDSGLMGDRSATVIGVLEPSIPYPQDTELIANIVTSPHHLSATMVTGRVHRMTEPPALRRWRCGRHMERAAAGGHPGPLRVALLGSRPRFNCRLQPSLGRSSAGCCRRGNFGVCSAPAVGRHVQWP